MRFACASNISKIPFLQIANNIFTWSVNHHRTNRNKAPNTSEDGLKIEVQYLRYC